MQIIDFELHANRLFDQVVVEWIGLDTARHFVSGDCFQVMVELGLEFVENVLFGEPFLGQLLEDLHEPLPDHVLHVHFLCLYSGFELIFELTCV